MAFRLFLTICLLRWVFSQAPGDEDSLCVDPLVDNGTVLVPNPFFSVHPSYPAYIRPLMDSRDYMSLLDEPGPAWQHVDNDTSNGAGESTSWEQQTGSICKQSVQACGFDIGPQNNWLITQHIRRTVYNDQLLSHVSVEVEVELNGCDVSRQCRQSFDVYRWDTSDIDSAAARSVQNYIFVDRISPEDTSGIETTTTTLTMDLTSSKETGFYLAIVDLSTCIVVHHLLVFYYVCPAETSNLITRPETMSPESAISGQCIENSSPTSSDQPLLSCTVMGTWDIIIGCGCNPGFQGVTEDAAVMSCAECPAGTYSDSVSNSPCQSCPDNSDAAQTGLSKCLCVQNYYRAPDEGAGEACTRPPSAPRNVSVSSMTNTTAVLSWLPPEDDGGRDPSEIHYIVIATGAGTSVSVEVTLGDTAMAEVTGLTPFTEYTFSVTSENAVSPQATDTCSSTSTATATTLEGAAGTVTDIKQIGSSIVSWSPPDPPNGMIIYYNVRITHSENREVEQFIKVFGDTGIDISSYVDSNGDFTVEVQALTIVGPGNFSLPVTVTVTVRGNKKSDYSVMVGVAIAVMVVIILLTIVAGLLSAYVIKHKISSRKRSSNDGTHTHEISDTNATPPLPLRIQQNAAYGISL